jgi:charged multivesicular body protein 6
MGNNTSTHKISAQDKCVLHFPFPFPSFRTLQPRPPRTLTNTHPRAILDMKNQRDKLHQYQRRITVLTDRETSIARQMLAAGDKKRALLALRRKKYQESLLAKTDKQLEQLEQLTSSVEFALVQKDVVFGLEQGTSVLKEIHREMGGLDRVEMLMGETAEAVAYQQVSFEEGVGVGRELIVRRRLVICWGGRFRIRMRMRWKMSWRRWRGRLWGGRRLWFSL